ncbi:MAG: hypothetical protein GY737_32160 [Desulfobacteraceae bacterium]|nr:hypothetical protein [Desulfobacteraceae bacterium]
MTAKSLDDVYECFKNEPVKINELETFYVDADKGRGKPIKKKLERRLKRAKDDNLRFLFAGHKGCGKSTELVRLQDAINDDFVVINFSVVKELDIVNINYIEIFIAVMEQLFNFVDETPKIEIDPEYLENILNWVKTREIEEISQNYMGMDIETQAKAGVEIPFFATFFAKFRAAAKSSSSFKEVLKTKIEPKLSTLIFNCNQLIAEIKNNLHHIQKKGLVLVIEDLDKVDIDKGMDMFYNHSTQLTQLHCHCIYTFPIALRYNTLFTPIKVNYTDTFVLPMIKVREKNGDRFDAGVTTLTSIVEKRMDLSLFENKEILPKMIQISGGCMWDLFRLIKDAADNALDYDREKISDDDYRIAVTGMQADYMAQIAENPEKGIKVEDYYQELAKCALAADKKPKSTDIMLDLRNNLSVLNYNGEDWSDVHPIVKEILREKGYLASETEPTR